MVVPGLDLCPCRFWPYKTAFSQGKRLQKSNPMISKELHKCNIKTHQLEYKNHEKAGSVARRVSVKSRDKLNAQSFPNPPPQTLSEAGSKVTPAWESCRGICR
jgi:hypothetical protein